MGNAELVFELEILCPKWAGVETLLGLAVLQKQKGEEVEWWGGVPLSLLWTVGLACSKQNQAKHQSGRSKDGGFLCSASDSFLTYLNLRESNGTFLINPAWHREESSQMGTPAGSEPVLRTDTLGFHQSSQSNTWNL